MAATIAAPQWPEEEKAFALDLDAHGFSASKIAEELNREFGTMRTRNSVIGIIHRSGVREKRGKRTKVRSTAGPPRTETSKRHRKERMENIALDQECLAAEVPETHPPSPEGGVSIMDLERWHCRRVVHERPAMFCGKPAAFNTSWCTECAPQIFTKDGFERLLANKKAPIHLRAAA